jgi:hypothetical protein
MSILAMYHRIGNGKRGLPWLLDSKIIWSLGVFVTVYTIAIFIVSEPIRHLPHCDLTSYRPRYLLAHQSRGPGMWSVFLRAAFMRLGSISRKARSTSQRM